MQFSVNTGSISQSPREGRSPTLGFAGGSVVKNPPAKLETQASSTGQEDPLEKGLANPLPYYCLEISYPEESGGLQSLGSQESGMTQQLSTHAQLANTEDPITLTTSNVLYYFSTHVTA